MTTIEEVVKMWDKEHSNMQTEFQKGKNLVKDTYEKIKSGNMYERPDKQAVIRLSNDHSFEPWKERTCYVFNFKLESIEISFERRTEHASNTEAFDKFLKENFNGKTTESGNKLILNETRRKNKHHLVLGITFNINTSAQNICKGMEELIKSTRIPIYEFLMQGNKEKILIMKLKTLLDEWR